MICQTFVKIDLDSQNTLISEMKMDKDLAYRRKDGLFQTKVYFGEREIDGMVFEPAMSHHILQLKKLQTDLVFSVHTIFQANRILT